MRARIAAQPEAASRPTGQTMPTDRIASRRSCPTVGRVLIVALLTNRCNACRLKRPLAAGAQRTDAEFAEQRRLPLEPRQCPPGHHEAALLRLQDDGVERRIEVFLSRGGDQPNRDGDGGEAGQEHPVRRHVPERDHLATLEIIAELILGGALEVTVVEIKWKERVLIV